MKRLLSIASIVALLALSLTAVAQNSAGQNPASGQQPQQQQVDTHSARSFEGKIMKSGDKLVLQDSATQQSYQLDDQDKAKQFEGKSVKVTATLDPNTNTLHIVDIGAGENK